MEEQIVALNQRLENDSEFKNAVAQLDQNLLQANLNSVARLSAYFAYDENLNDYIVQMAWRSLEVQTLYFLRQLDDIGISRIIGKVAPEYLYEFSFREAVEFRAVEENLLNQLQVPNDAWDRFWSLVDENKNQFLSEMQVFEAYSFYQHLSPFIYAQLLNTPNRFRPMSPFKWSRAIIGGIGTSLGIVDWSPPVLALAVGTMGIGLGVAAASTIAAGVAAGYVIKKEGQK
ncbi:MAG TPA: hypothetical protein VF527_18205 [Pyrinomonadaceae bacterium]|jgi:hypothetical protein